MAYTMMLSGNYGTHLAPLIQAINKTDGDILEMGVGIFSTPYLHYQSFLTKRKLVSYDNDLNWLNKFANSIHASHRYEGPYHTLKYVKRWEEAQIEKPWDVALIDHSPPEQRIIDIKRLANFAKYIIVHDTNVRHEKLYNYPSVYPLFKYRTLWDGDENKAMVFSNFVDLSDFWQ